MNDAYITLVGNLASDPQHSAGDGTSPRTSFRFAHTPRIRRPDGWADGDTTFFQVTCWRQLALNAARSLRKGDRVIIRGSLRARDWSNGERSGTSLEINADNVGHDLAFAVSVAQRTARDARPQPDPALQVDPAPQDSAAPAPAPAADDVAA